MSSTNDTRTTRIARGSRSRWVLIAVVVALALIVAGFLLEGTTGALGALAVLVVFAAVGYGTAKIAESV